jgi:hypothetical protein
MELETIVEDVADVLKGIDRSSAPFRQFQPGIGPYGEPQLVKLVAAHLRDFSRYGQTVKTMRTPDLLISGHWALEIKLARPFGDNGKPAENWSVNLLHPYNGNTSLLGDCLKLQSMTCGEQRGVLAIGYEHEPPQVSLEPLWRAFEVVATEVLDIRLGPRVQAKRNGLVHPVHQQLTVIGWKVN